jgi:hypothetical protein
MFDSVKAGEVVAGATLRNRQIAQERKDVALAAGDQKEARRWASELRKLDKLIARYRLDRHT